MSRAQMVFEDLYAYAEDYLRQEMIESCKKLNISEKDIDTFEPNNADEAKLLKTIKIDRKILGKNK